LIARHDIYCCCQPDVPAFSASEAPFVFPYFSLASCFASFISSTTAEDKWSTKLAIVASSNVAGRVEETPVAASVALVEVVEGSVMANVVIGDILSDLAE
jgi:hypothetical protein